MIDCDEDDDREVKVKFGRDLNKCDCSEAGPRV